MAAVVGTARQGDLTTECWSVQLFGLEHCETCEARGTPECGGKSIRRTGRNSKGVRVPIGELREIERQGR
jgi:hypothetical protein